MTSQRLGSNTHLYLTWNWGTTNDNGNLQSSTASHGGPGYQTFLTFNDSYLYDGVNRLAAVYDRDVNNVDLWARIFNYDRYGNMWLNVNSGVPLYGTTPTASTNFNTATNRLISGARFDAAGNQTEVGSYSVAYDAENRQSIVEDNVSEGQASYGYDGLGQRVTKSNNGLVSTLYVYDIFGNLAAEYNSFGAQQSPCATCYLSYDHLGSVRMVTNNSSNGNADIIARHDYLPFGEEIPANTVGRQAEWGPFSDKVDQKFTGQERDDETGFDFFQARYFYGAQGRWISPDPAFQSEILELPQTWNRYTYVYNRPLSITDPDGRCPPCLGAIIGGVVEGGWNLGSQLYQNGGNFSQVSSSDVGASAAGGAVTGAIAGATGGGSLVADALWGAGANVAGGIVTRTAEGEDASDVLSPGDISLMQSQVSSVVELGMLLPISFTFLKNPA